MKSQPSLRADSSPGRQYLYNGVAHPQLRVAPYRYPTGFAYRRFFPGRAFPRTRWVRDYYIYNYVDFGVPPPTTDTQWIRFGPDLLLLDLDTGLIRQVVYGAFYEGDEGGPGDGGA